jgi:hypothetical protein
MAEEVSHTICLKVKYFYYKEMINSYPSFLIYLQATGITASIYLKGNIVEMHAMQTKLMIHALKDDVVCSFFSTPQGPYRCTHP